MQEDWSKVDVEMTPTEQAEYWHSRCISQIERAEKAEEEADSLRADLAAAREQVAGAWVAAAQVANDGFIVTEGDGVAAWIRDRIKALTPSDATAALEARIQRERAEVVAIIDEEIAVAKEVGPIGFASVLVLKEIKQKIAESRKAGGG